MSTLTTLILLLARAGIDAAAAIERPSSTDTRAEVEVTIRRLARDGARTGDPLSRIGTTTAVSTRRLTLGEAGELLRKRGVDDFGERNKPMQVTRRAMAKRATRITGICNSQLDDSTTSIYP